MKQTAVEWLEQQLYKSGWQNLTHEEKMNICATAKLIEIDQMRAVNMLTYLNKDFDFEKFMKEKETFKSE
jgi:hypothetical protein